MREKHFPDYEISLIDQQLIGGFVHDLYGTIDHIHSTIFFLRNTKRNLSDRDKRDHFDDIFRYLEKLRLSIKAIDNLHRNNFNNNKIERVDISRLLSKIFDVLRNKIRNSRISIRKQVEDVFIECDEQQMFHALLSIIIDSIESLSLTSKQERYLTLHCYSKDMITTLEINDNGNGARNSSESLEDDYAETTTYLNHRLLLAKKIIDSHNGNFKVVNKEGKVRAVIIDLPPRK